MTYRVVSYKKMFDCEDFSNINDNSLTNAMLISRNTFVVNLTALAVLQFGISINSTGKTKL